MNHKVNSNQRRMISKNGNRSFRKGRVGGNGRDFRFGQNGGQNREDVRYGPFIRDRGSNNFSNNQVHQASRIPQRFEEYRNKSSAGGPSSFYRNEYYEPMEKRMRFSENNLPHEVILSTSNEMQIKQECELPNSHNGSSNSNNASYASSCNIHSKPVDVTSLLHKLEFHGLIAKPKPKEDIKTTFEKQWNDMKDEKIPALSNPVVPDGSPPLCPKCQDYFNEYYSDLDDCLHYSGVIEEDGDYYHINCYTDLMRIKRLRKNDPNYDNLNKEVRGYESVKQAPYYL